MKNTVEVPLPELDIFAHPRIQKSVLQTIETKHRPITSIGEYKQGLELHFHINLADDEYLLLQETFVYIKCHLQAKGILLELSEDKFGEVYPANNMLHTMIERVRVGIGSNQPSIDILNYGYKAYFETLLGYSEKAKNTHLRCGMWLEDKAERIEAMFVDNTVKKTASARPMELCGRLHYDFMHQGKAIIGGCNVVIIISFQAEKFFLATNSVEDVTIKLDDVFIKAKRYKVSPSIVSAHKKALAHTSAKYPLSTARIHTMIIPKNSLFSGLENVITGIIPSRLFVALVEKADFNGGTKTDPFKFKHQNVANMTIFIDGVQMQSTPEISADFGNNRLIEAYDRLYDVLNQNDTDPVCDITLADFVDNKCIFAFDLSADHSGTDP